MATNLFRGVVTNYRQFGLCRLHKNRWQYLVPTAYASSNSASQELRAPDGAELPNDWRPIYRLPMAGAVSAFNRLKMYQGLFTILGLPMAVILEQAGRVDPHASAIFFAVGLTTTLTLAVGSLLSKNLIGYVYINQVDSTKLRIAYLDFWGRRCHVTVTPDALEPVVARSPLLHTIFRTVEWHGGKRGSKGEVTKFKLLSSYGEIIDNEAFHSLFGD